MSETQTPQILYPELRPDGAHVAPPWGHARTFTDQLPTPKNTADDGVIRIGKQGVKKYAFATGPAFEVDLVRAFDWWIEIDGTFRGADGAVPKDQLAAWNKARVNFARLYVTALARPAPDGSPPALDQQVANEIVAGMDDAQCLGFLLSVESEVGKLKDFFAALTGAEPSPAPPSESATVFTE